MKKEDKKTIIFGVALLAMAFAVVFVVADYNASTWTKTYRLNDQYIESINPQRTQGLASCDNCLIMEVRDEWWTPSRLMAQNLTLFFANEHSLRNDLQSGDVITVRWRWIDGERLIRGVWKE